MKLKKNVDILSFMDAVQKCRHDVYFDTAEGDHLDLKSTLSQFVFASAVAVKLPHLEAEIRCRKEDLPILRPFLEE